MPNAVQRGLALGCEAIAVFTRNQKQWAPKPLAGDEVEAFRRAAAEAGYAGTTVSHASYLINLCATDDAVRGRSRTAFRDELVRCDALEIPFLCLHPGSHMGAGEEKGIAAIAENVRAALDAPGRAMVLFENTAGQGTNLGWRFEHLAELLQLVGSDRAGVCIDTCHLFAAGNDLRGAKAYEATMRALDDTVGLARVRAFHLNDSKHDLGSRRDRHEHIGEGAIGEDAFRRLVNDARFAEHPALLETPDAPEGYERNLALLKKMRKTT
jgi:deoxyribonuclease-4